MPRLLLEKLNVDVNYQYGTGFSPLSNAILDCNEVVELLVDHGVDVNVIDAWGNTMLELARLRNNDVGEALLLKAGALEVISAEAAAVYGPHYRKRILYYGAMEAGEADEETAQALDRITELGKLRSVLASIRERQDPGRSWQEILK